MEIKGINNNQAAQYYKAVNSNAKKEPNEMSKPKVSDKLEISDDAKKLSGEKVDKAKINKIKKRVEMGFYNSNAVLTTVAERILKEIG